jgi:streptogramin lyase
MIKHSALALACALAVLLSGCGGSGGGAGGPLPAPSASPPVQQQSNAQFVVHIPAFAAVSSASIKSNSARPMDFSASTQSLKVSIATQVLTIADVSATSSLCKAASGGGRDCTVNVVAPNGSDQFTLTAYDQPNAGGNAIAQATIQATISAQPTTVNVAVAGTIAKLAIALSNQYPPVGAATTVNVTVTALDADGNAVLGAYGTPISLQDSDTSGATSLSAITIASSSTAVTLNYTGAEFMSATITASMSGVGSATATFAPTPAFLSTYPVPTAAGPRGPVEPGPWNIANGPDGNMWVVATGTAEVIKIASNGGMTVYPMPSPSSRLQGIVVGSDGNLWFAESGNNSIGKITTSGVVTSYQLPQSFTSPQCVGLGKDGNVWFFDAFNHVLGSITPGGTIAEYPVPSTSFIAGITSGSDGNLWMTDITGNAILKVSTSGQVLATYAVPSKNAQPRGITAGPDGNTWFTEYSAGKIGRVTPSGTIAEFALPSAGAGPMAITAGPDGRMWFAEMGPFAGQGKIGYITVDGTQVRDFFGDGYHVHDLAFDANGTLWYVGLKALTPFDPQEIGTFAW